MATFQISKKFLTVHVRHKRTRRCTYETTCIKLITEWNQWEKVISSLDSYSCWSPPVVLGHTVCSIGPTYIFHTVAGRFFEWVWVSYRNNMATFQISKRFLTVHVRQKRLIVDWFLSRTSRLCTVFWYNRIRRRVEQSKSKESHRSTNLFDFQTVLCGVNLIFSPFGIILLAIYARKLDTWCSVLICLRVNFLSFLK
jgi:hypothetical protein